MKNEDGDIISKKVSSEKILAEAVDEVIETGSQEPLRIERIFWVLFSIIIPAYSIFINKNTNTIFSNILNKKGKIKTIYYIIYFLFVFPVFIDMIIILVDLYKNRKKLLNW